MDQNKLGPIQSTTSVGKDSLKHCHFIRYSLFWIQHTLHWPQCESTKVFQEIRVLQK